MRTDCATSTCTGIAGGPPAALGPPAEVFPPQPIAIRGAITIRDTLAIKTMAGLRLFFAFSLKHGMVRRISPGPNKNFTLPSRRHQGAKQDVPVRRPPIRLGYIFERRPLECGNFG